VPVTAIVETFTRYLFSPATAAELGIGIEGSAEAVERFERLIGTMVGVVSAP